MVVMDNRIYRLSNNTVKGVDIMGYGGEYGAGKGFALIVVLFILLVIVGSAYVN